MADEFWKFMYDDVAQLILTTHSPIFYNLNEKNTDDEFYVSCHHIYLDSQESGTEITHDSDELDQCMGTMSLLAPKILSLQNEIIEQEKAKQVAEKLAESNRAKIFVEGPSDKLILEKLISIYYPEYIDRVDVETKNGGAGHGYVYDMLSAWHAIRTHDHEKPMAAGLVDADTSGSDAAKRWNNTPSHINSCKCFKLNTPPKLYDAYQKGFKIPITLEVLYPKDIWDYALNKGHLKKRGHTGIIPESLINDILNGDKKLSNEVDDTWGIYVNYDFANERKIATAKYLSKKDNEECKVILSDFKNLTEEIIEYLFNN